MRLNRSYQCPRLCAAKFWSRWKIFKVLLLLCVAGFAYVYLEVTPYSNQGIILVHASIPDSTTAGKTYSSGANDLTPNSLKSGLSTSTTTQPKVNEIEHLSTSQAITASFGDISSEPITASFGEISSQLIATSFGDISVLAITASLGDISSLAATVSVAAEKSNINTNSAVREILSSVTAATASEIPAQELTPNYSTVYPRSTTEESTSDTTSNPSTTDSSTTINNASSISTASSPTAEGASVSPSGVTGSSADIPTLTNQSTALVPTSAAAAALSGNDAPLYVTSSFTGRLGNQMFIYAALIGIARAQNRTVFIKSGTDLEATFQITHLNDSIDPTGWENEGEAHYATFDFKFMNLTHVNKTISGYFQSWRYFHQNQDEVRREFKFKDEILAKAQEHLQKFKNESGENLLVGVHVRRGDYLADYNVKLGYGVPQASYFHNAFRTIRKLFPDKNATFLIASDDLGWCKENLKDPDVRIVAEESPLVHFAVLANCDHVVLSGGTYGWWAAWLSPGVKIYYSKFVVNGSWLEDGFTREDYYPPGWIGLDNMESLTSATAASGLAYLRGKILHAIWGGT